MGQTEMEAHGRFWALGKERVSPMESGMEEPCLAELSKGSSLRKQQGREGGPVSALPSCRKSGGKLGGPAWKDFLGEPQLIRRPGTACPEHQGARGLFSPTSELSRLVGSIATWAEMRALKGAFLLPALQAESIQTDIEAPRSQAKEIQTSAGDVPPLPLEKPARCSRMIRPNFQILSAQGLLLLCTLSYLGARGPYAAAEPDAISGAAIFSNHSLNGTGLMPLTCQSFQCSGERCYQDQAHGNNSQLCHNASHCELYRLNSTSYTARCSSDCGGANATEMCLRTGGLGLELCIVECCNSSDCLQLNATAYGDEAATTTPVPTTTTTTTTTTAPPRNGKVCSSFTCHGEGCYKGQKSSANCIVGHDFCEMKKTGSHFVAGCSQHCKTKGHPCTHKSPAACYQECCQAMPKTSCLKLDGKVHFNRASGLASPPLLQLLAWAALLGLSCSSSFLTGIN